MMEDKTVNTRRSNFIGHDGFYWWIGVVESRMDPLNVGRCKVRIHGLHTEDKNLIPTDALPWSQPLYPLNNTTSTPTTLKEGDHVMGFFMDGDSAQFPVIMGMFHGIPEDEADTQSGYHDPRTTEQLKTAPQNPEIQYKYDGTGAVITNRPKLNYPENINEPTVARISRNENILKTIVADKAKSLSVAAILPLNVIPDFDFKSLGTLGEQATTAGITNITTITNGLSNGLGNLSKTLSSQANSYTNNALGTFADAASDTSKSFADASAKSIGISGETVGYLSKLEASAISTVGSAVDAAYTAMEEGMNALVSVVSDSITSTISNIQNEIKTSTSQVGATLDDLSSINPTKMIKDAMSGVLGEVEAVLGKGIDIASSIGNFIGKMSLPDILELDNLAISNLVDFAAADALTSNITKSIGFWKEPTVPYNTKYPYNQAIQSESGHIFEMDDTPGAERTQLYHRSGTFTETHPDGTTVTKIVKDNYTIVLADNRVSIYGNAELTVQGDANIHVQKNCSLYAEKNMYCQVKGNWKNDIYGDLEWVVNGDVKMTANGHQSTYIKNYVTVVTDNTYTTLVASDSTHTVKGKYQENVVGTYTVGVTDNISISGDNNMTTTINKSTTATSGENMNIFSGIKTMLTSSGTTITSSGATTLTSSGTTITSSGATTIKGSIVTINP